MFFRHRCAAWAVAAGLAVSLPAAAQAADTPFTFHWTAPAEADVTVAVRKRGHDAEYRYTLAVTRDDATGDFILETRDFVPLSVGGHPITTDQERRAVAPAIAMLSAVPAFRVGADGTFKGVDGDLDAMFDKIAPLFHGHPAVERIFTALRESPQMREAMEGRLADTWNAWVGLWIGFDKAPGESAQVPGEAHVFGQTWPAAVDVTREGDSAACNGCVRMRATMKVEGAAFREAWGDIMRAMVAGSGRPGDIDGMIDSVESVARETVTRADTDPATLRPVAVTREIALLVKPRDGSEERRVESYRYTFRWH